MDSQETKNRHIKLIGFTSVLILAVLVAFFVYNHVFLALASVGWDEGAHLLDAYSVAIPLHRGRIIEALKNSYQQLNYPPGYSWFVALWSFIGGISLSSFRNWSLVAFVLVAVLLYRLTTIIENSKKGVIAGVISSFLFISAPLYWIYSSLAMLEVTGAMATLIVAILLVRAINDPRKGSRRWWIAGFSLAVLNLVKYNYVFMVVAALVVDFICEIWLNRRPPWRRLLGQALAVFTPYFVGLGLWVAGSGRLAAYIRFMTDPIVYSYKFTSIWGHLFEYFSSSLAINYLVSPILSILYIFGIFYFFRSITKRYLRLVSLVFFANLFLATIHMDNQQERYIATTVPMLYVLAGLGTVEIYRIVEKVFREKIETIKIITFIIIIIIITFIVKDLYWNVEHIRGIGEHLANSPLFGSSDYHDTLFSFNRDEWPHGSRLTETPIDVANWAITNSDPTRQLVYAGATNEISPPVLEFLRAVKRDGYEKAQQLNTVNKTKWSQYAATYQIGQNSVLAGYDYQRMNRGATEQGLVSISSDPSWQKVAEKNFDQLDVTAIIWGR